jgi:hypothetical protein
MEFFALAGNEEMLPQGAWSRRLPKRREALESSSGKQGAQWKGRVGTGAERVTRSPRQTDREIGKLVCQTPRHSFLVTS